MGHLFRFAFLGGLLALVVANVSTLDDGFSCRSCEVAFSADADGPDFLYAPTLEAEVFARLAESSSGDFTEGDAARTSSRVSADPAAGGGSGTDERMPTTRPCPGYQTIEEMLALAP